MKSTANSCLNEIEDFAEYIDNGLVHVIFLANYPGRSPKAPRKTFLKKDWESVQSILAEPELNLGISFAENDGAEITLCAIDVDGIKGQGEDIELGSKLLLANIITEGLQKRNIQPMVVKSLSNGFHIYLWCKHYNGTKHYPGMVIWPNRVDIKTAKFQQRDEFKQYPQLVNLLGHPLDNKFVELFTNNGMTVAPGTVIDGRQYKVLDCGAQHFSDISIYEDGDFEDLVLSILLENQFKYKTQAETTKDNSQNFDINDDKNILSQENIKNIGELVLQTWPLISGQKQEASLALGGFLYTRNISQKSIIDIGNYVIDNKDDPELFKGNDEYERTNGFMAALLHDSKENREKPKRGLGALATMLDGKYDTSKFKKILWLNAAPQYHQFYPKGMVASLYPKITLDFDNKEIRYQVVKLQEEGDMTVEIIQPNNEIVHHMISNFIYIDDISDPRNLSDIEKPIQFVIETRNKPPHTYILENRGELFKKYHHFEGAYHVQGKDIIQYIFMEFELLDLINTEEGSSRPGVYLTKDKKRIRKYIDSEDGLIEHLPNKPDKSELVNALELLSDINDALPWRQNKFGAVVKLALLQPYGFVFKMNKRWIPGIILYGEAGTLKSTVGELLCRLSTPIVEEDKYITNGSEIDSEYRMGRDFAYHSYPVVINECLNVFSNQGNVELLKNAMDKKLIRSPGGENAETYYARSVPIITLNDTLEAMNTREFARRFLSINLTSNDAYTQEEINEHLRFLNKDNVQNSRFDELGPIGDFVFYYLYNNMHLFSYDIYKTMDFIVEALENETEMNLDWLKVDLLEYIDIDMDTSSQLEIDVALNVLRRPFLENKKRMFSKSEEQGLWDMIQQEYSYIFFTNKDEILITRGFEKEFNTIPDKTIKLSRLAELLDSYCDGGVEDIATKDIRGSTREHRKQRRGITLSWDSFVEIIGINRETDKSVQDIINGGI